MIYALFAVLFALLLLYIMPISVRLAIVKDNKNDQITIELRTLYGLVNLKNEIPFLVTAFENGKPVLKYKLELANRKRSRLLAKFTKLFSMEEGEGLLKAYKKYRNKIGPVLKFIAKKTIINDFSLRLSMGTGDAAETGVLYGTAWIIIGNAMAFTSSYLKINNPEIVIVPIFNCIQFCVDFSCIISMKTGHIINAGIKAVLLLLSGMDKK